VRLFLMGDAASCAKAGQEVPKGFYNLERMLRIAHARGTDEGVGASFCIEDLMLDNS
jgi:uncharacterized protein involved in oxidation of intracellular sulfur